MFPCSAVVFVSLCLQVRWQTILVRLYPLVGGEIPTGYPLEGFVLGSSINNVDDLLFYFLT